MEKKRQYGIDQQSLFPSAFAGDPRPMSGMSTFAFFFSIRRAPDHRLTLY